MLEGLCERKEREGTFESSPRLLQVDERLHTFCQENPEKAILGSRVQGSGYLVNQ